MDAWVVVDRCYVWCVVDGVLVENVESVVWDLESRLRVAAEAML